MFLSTPGWQSRYYIAPLNTDMHTSGRDNCGELISVRGFSDELALVNGNALVGKLIFAFDQDIDTNLNS